MSEPDKNLKASLEAQSKALDTICESLVKLTKEVRDNHAAVIRFIKAGKF